MSKNLSELLADARGAPIRFGDVDVTAIYELAINEPSKLKISLEQASRAIPQALHMKTEGGTLIANGMALKDAIFWTDTAPSSFEVSFTPSRSKALLKLWNEWRDRSGVENAWIGNAGIVITRSDNEILLRCSDGIGEPTFDDLVVRIQVESNVINFAAHRRRRQKP